MLPQLMLGLCKDFPLCGTIDIKSLGTDYLYRPPVTVVLYMYLYKRRDVIVCLALHQETGN